MINIWENLILANNLENTVSYTSIIQGFAETNLDNRAIETYEMMLSRGIPRDNFTYATMLTICANNILIGKGNSILNEIFAKNKQFLGN